jgi:FMN reductase
MPLVLTLSGSPSQPSRSAGVLAYSRDYLQKCGISTDHIAIRDLDPQDLIWGRYDSPALQATHQQVAQADGVILSSPVYKAAYSGVLKTYLDLLPTKALAGKVVLPIATGGSPAHLLMLDYSFKPVLGVLGAEYILNGLYFTDTQLEYTEDYSIRFTDADAAQRLHKTLDSFISILDRKG